MTKTVLHIFTLLMLAATTLPVVVPASLLLARLATRMEMEERLEHEKSVTIRVSKKDIDWIGTRECMINGRMFDVKGSIEQETLFILEGIFDDEETAIEEELSDQAARDEQGEGSLFYKYKQMEARATQGINLAISITATLPDHHGLSPEPLFSLYFKTPAPPPKLSGLYKC